MTVRIGPAGWSYKDWAGRVYPDPRPAGFDELTFVADRFDCIELNTTFYRPPGATMVEGWVRRTAHRPDFRFTAKLWRRLTHETGDWGEAEVRPVREGLAPLIQAGRLGALLAQFPWSFRDGARERDRLKRIAGAFPGMPLVVEVRHVSWGGAIDFFRGIGAGFCNVDQPASATSLQETAHVTSGVGYVRFHGRNAAAWFRRDAGRDQKYDYLYSADELRPWMERIRAMAREAPEVYVVMNNHFRGQAVVNAIQLMLELTPRRPMGQVAMLESPPASGYDSPPDRDRPDPRRPRD